jgi:hypothetical protein
MNAVFVALSHRAEFTEQSHTVGVTPMAYSVEVEEMPPLPGDGGGGDFDPADFDPNDFKTT